VKRAALRAGDEVLVALARLSGELTPARVERLRTLERGSHVPRVAVRLGDGRAVRVTPRRIVCKASGLLALQHIRAAFARHGGPVLLRDALRGSAPHSAQVPLDVG
jgi:hypothetical protein